MNAQKKTEPSASVNLGTLFTTLFAGLMLAGIIWVITSISDLQKSNITINSAIGELQRSMNRLNSKK